MSNPDRLRELASDLHHLAAEGRSDQVESALAALEEAAMSVSRAWSGSNLGFHACVYYKNLQSPPPGAHFSREWGFSGMFQGTTGEWVEYDRNELTKHIYERAGNPDITMAEALAERAIRTSEEARNDAVSIISTFDSQGADEYLQKLRSEIEVNRPGFGGGSASWEGAG